MSKSVADLESSISNGLTAICASLGISKTTDISNDQAKMDAVSYAVDARNEAWNNTLGTRPHA